MNRAEYCALIRISMRMGAMAEASGDRSAAAMHRLTAAQAEQQARAPGESNKERAS